MANEALSYAELHEVWAALPRDARRHLVQALPEQTARALHQYQIDTGVSEAVALEEARAFVATVASKGLGATEIQDMTVAQLRRTFAEAQRKLQEAGDGGYRVEVAL